MPDSVSVPAPVLVSEPPVPPLRPPSLRTPENVVERSLPPTVRVFAPRKIVPAPSIEPAVVPPVESAEMSKKPVVLKMKRAVPPLALSNIKIWPLLVMVALAAVLVLKNSRRLSLAMAALPAVLASLKIRVPKPRKGAKALLVMAALPAVLVLKNCKVPWLVMVALPAVLVSKKFRPPWGPSPSKLLMMVALPAELALVKFRNALKLLVMVALPAVLVLLNCKMALLVILALPPLIATPAPLNVSV